MPSASSNCASSRNIAEDKFETPLIQVRRRKIPITPERRKTQINGDFPEFPLLFVM
jgi:hypothetical protein